MLTDEEIKDIMSNHPSNDYDGIFDLCKDIERAVLAKAAEQEPVAVMGNNGRVQAKCEFSGIDSFLKCCRNNTPFYAHQLPAQAIPEGWRLVPIEPTHEMVDAYKSNSSAGHLSEIGYKAMLSASPKT